MGLKIGERVKVKRNTLAINQEYIGLEGKILSIHIGDFVPYKVGLIVPAKSEEYTYTDYFDEDELLSLDNPPPPSEDAEAIKDWLNGNHI